MSGSGRFRNSTVLFSSVRPVRSVSLSFLEEACCRASIPTFNPHAANYGSLSLNFFKIHQRGVRWKQGVVIYMILYTSLLYSTTPIHCTPLRLHPPLMNTQQAVVVITLMIICTSVVSIVVSISSLLDIYAHPTDPTLSPLRRLSGSALRTNDPD